MADPQPREGDQVASMTPPLALSPAPAGELAQVEAAGSTWGLGDTVLIANPSGQPQPARVLAQNPARPGLLKVTYLASGSAAWVARARVLGPAPLAGGMKTRL